MGVRTGDAGSRDTCPRSLWEKNSLAWPVPQVGLGAANPASQALQADGYDGHRRAYRVDVKRKNSSLAGSTGYPQPGTPANRHLLARAY